MKKLLQNPAHFFACIVFLIGTVFLACLTYHHLDKGFIFNDEAYYLSYYKNKGESLSFDRTNFFRIFRFLYTPNIYHFRIISITTLVLSNFLLCCTIFKYLKFDNSLFFYSLIGIFIGFESWNISNLIIQQYIGNTILVNVGISLMLISLIIKKKFILTLSGFVLSFILFNGNSHVVVIIPILIFFIVSDSENRKSNLLYLFSGYIIGVIVYFTFLDTLDNFVFQFKFLKEYLSFHRKQHSRTFIVLWCVYLFLNAILPTAIAYFFLWEAKFSENSIKTLNKLIALLGILTILLLCLKYEFYLFSLILFTHILALRFWIEKNETLKNKYVIILLLIIPYCLAFGSQTWFHLRLNAYKLYYFLLIFICLMRLYKNNLWVAGYLIKISIMIFVFPDVLKDKGWKDFVFTEQTEKVKVNGYPLYLDKQRKKDLDILHPYLQNQPDVIYSSNHLMGYLYILDASPPIYYYFELKDYIRFIIKKTGKTPDDFIYFESIDYPFNPKEIVPLQFVDHPENYKIVKTGRFTLYLPSKYKK
ncbi:hypothetical protein [Chryseobacterium populi]|uniref:Glycosyltransferase RgtA/B/C/D-like domain-containing protein n=1 Tax=Chryseobacterium populi TaxID=1144316 RepID=J2SQ61_9FLAO|nr:hypothetical protein [Chryseobacterium populi]EJL67647.1 hypothetical protein PMI13_04083 [Chryseobacterium populi]